MNPESADSSDAFPDPFGSAEGAVLRLIDANANRAREALRVLEDYTRFVLDDAGLSKQLKAVRHGLADATRAILPVAILHRDTPGDVGTTNKTPAELERADLADVVVAAGKRLGEALRSIEEYLKTIAPAASQAVEALRYTSYELERRVAMTLRPLPDTFADVQLYVLITESLCKQPWLEAAEQAIWGGADCLQLREKSLDSGELLLRAKQMVRLCRDYGILSIINDRPDIALLAGADGVHVGQGDLPAAEVRKILGPNRLVGVSTHNIEQAKQAVLDGADYIGVGPFFYSSTKPRDFVAGPEYARQVAEQIKIPAVAIAGITAENVGEVLATGVKAIAVTSAVLAAEDVEAAARGLKKRLSANRPNGGQTFLSVTRPQNAASHSSAPPNPASRLLNPSSAPSQSQSSSAGNVHSTASTFTRRHLPHLQKQGATYFLTFRMVIGEMDAGERQVVMEHLKTGDGKYYMLIAAMIMPDHVHMLIRPMESFTLERIAKGTKGVTANLLNRRRKRTGQVWQDESYDRIVRDRDSLAEQLKYMRDNPVRKGLVVEGEAWDGWYFSGRS